MCNSLQFCNSAVHCAVRSWRTVENEASWELQCCRAAKSCRAAKLQCGVVQCSSVAELLSCSAVLRKRRLDRSPLWESRMQCKSMRCNAVAIQGNTVAVEKSAKWKISQECKRCKEWKRWKEWWSPLRWKCNLFLALLPVCTKAQKYKNCFLSTFTLCKTDLLFCTGKIGNLNVQNALLA